MADYDTRMQSGQIDTRARYAAVTRQLAERAVSVATDSAPHRAREGEHRWPIARALPAARVLIDLAGSEEIAALSVSAEQLGDTLAEARHQVTDGFGHARPIYPFVAIHLLGTAARLVDCCETLSHLRRAATTLLDNASDQDDPRLGVWRRVVARQHGIHEAEQLPLPSGLPAPLVPLGLNDLIDSWTYYELVGVHGLHLCGMLEADMTLTQRVQSATYYHLGHTQPDYTTYQPWGLAAFVSDTHTAVFAEQQLHDVATHLSIEGPGSAVMPALLLADALATMTGRTQQAWESN